MRRIVILMLVGLMLPSLAEAQQRSRRGSAAAGGRKLNVPQSGTAARSSQNSAAGVSTLRIPSQPSYRPPAKPLGAPRPQQVTANPMSPRTRGGMNPMAGLGPQGSYARHAPVGGRRLRSQSAASVKQQLNRNLTRLSANSAINNRYSRGRGG